MKKVSLLILALMTVPAVCFGAVEISQWQYYKDINSVSQNVDGGLVKIVSDDDIFANSKKDLGDVRIIDESNKEVPFQLAAARAESSQASYSAKILNNSFVAGQYTSAILDLGAEGKLVNSLTINTSSENFKRNVKIYGSADMLVWNVLKDNAYVYDYTDRKGGFKSQNTTLNFPESTFRYLKLEISDEDNSPVKINSVSIRQEIVKNKKESERTIDFSVQENVTRKSTELVANLGMGGIPISKIGLQSAGINFNRGVIIYSSSDKNNNWHPIGQGYIFRYSTPKFSGENLQLNFPETKDRYLKIEILNSDNAPLAFSQFKAYSIYREIVFQTEKNKKYRIFYGNKKANYPEYDLEKFIQYLDTENSQEAILSGQKNNPVYAVEKAQEKPVSERWPFLFPTVLVLTSLILLLFVYKFLKR